MYDKHFSPLHPAVYFAQAVNPFISRNSGLFCSKGPDGDSLSDPAQRGPTLCTAKAVMTWMMLNKISRHVIVECQVYSHLIPEANT